MSMTVVEGAMHGGLPFMSVGSGPPLVIFPGLTAEHIHPSGMTRWFEIRTMKSLADRFTVHWINRKPGLARGSTIADLAAHYAAAIERDIGEPVLIEGVSTGGSIAQQFAIDHPHLVKRLVLVATACRLSDRGRELQRTLLEQTEAGNPRKGWAAMGSGMTSGEAGRRVMSWVMWLVGAAMSADDPSDMLITLAAEGVFDVSDELHRIEAPALVVGGENDGLYSPELFQRTAQGMRVGRLHLCQRKGHVGSVNDREARAEIHRFLSESLQ